MDIQFNTIDVAGYSWVGMEPVGDRTPNTISVRVQGKSDDVDFGIEVMFYTDGWKARTFNGFVCNPSGILELAGESAIEKALPLAKEALASKMWVR